MKKRLITATISAAVIMLTTISCYTFTLIEQPHEALTNSSFKGKVVVKRDGNSDNGLVQVVHGLFGICVPEGWTVGDDIVMTQVPLETTDVGDDEYKQVIKRHMVELPQYTDLLNRDYAKTGYTWIGLVTEETFKSLFNTKEQINEVDSIYVEFTVNTNDKTGTFYLDYIAGQVKTEDIPKIGINQDDWNTKAGTFKSNHIGSVTYADTHITVTRPDGTMDEDAFVDPGSVVEWMLEYMPEGSRPGGVMSYKDKKYDKLFTRTLGWNGGDGVFTVGLPNGDVFWTFNDSFYGTVHSSDRSRHDCSFPRNSIMVQKAGNDGLPGEGSKDLIWLADYVNWTRPSENTYMNARTHLRHPQGEKTDEQIAAGEIDQGKVYWSGDGRIYNGKLEMIWFGTESTELRNLGTSLATYSLTGNKPVGYYRNALPDYLPQEGNYLYRESVKHQINDNAVPYGSTLWEDEDGHNYLYATKGYKPVVGRTKGESLYSDWEYYVKDEDGNWHWQDNYPTEEAMERSSIIGTGDQGSLPWIFKEGDYYYLVMQAPYFSREVNIFRSESPVGPFTDKRLLMMLPDHIDKIGNQNYHWLYMVNLHPALSREGELVFTTNTDPDNFWDNFIAPGSADYYRPYFYRVFNWKSLYGLPNTTSVRQPKVSENKAKPKDNAYYTLQGIRVNVAYDGQRPSLAKGIYIHNGKKIYVE